MQMKFQEFTGKPQKHKIKSHFLKQISKFLFFSDKIESNNMDKWLRDSLSHCLKFDVPEDMVKYVMTLKTTDEFDEYFSSLLDPSFQDHRNFMSECKQRLFSKPLPNKKASNQNQQSSKVQNKSNKKQDKLADKSSSDKPSSNKPSVTAATPADGGGGKKKTKYVNLFTNDGKVPNVVMLKGRRRCDCYATEHNLINNCLSCGRVVCEQEGSGPCMFCGELVCTNEEMEIINSEGDKGASLKKSLEEKGGNDEGLRKAIEHRDRLLEYERDGAKRTEVIDDEDDYFEENSGWHSTADREKFQRLKQEMHEKRHANRSERKIKMDLFGREVFEEPVTQEYEDRIRREMAEAIAKSNAELFASHQTDDSDDIVSKVDFQPTYVPTGIESGKYSNRDFLETTINRVQDKELMEMQDMRRCISMHQPYASLLVYGVKKHEGRTWYSGHRGRLWIASTVKVPTQDEIKEVENFYKEHYQGKKLKFPSQYQTGCILGCVHVEDVLTQEEYRKRFPDGESESPYVFICKSPKVLPVVFPHSGSHKIYQLDPTVHRAASKALMKEKVLADDEPDDQDVGNENPTE